MKRSLSEIKTVIKSVIHEYLTRGDLNQVERHADNLFKDIGIDVEFTYHFLDRVNDPRNGKEIITKELIDLFSKTYIKYGQKIPQFKSGTEAVINDLNSNINIPFILKRNPRTGKFDLINKTVMRKKNFQTSNPKLEV